MKKISFLTLFGVALTACDCYQAADGIVLDNTTKEPLDNVALGKYVAEDTANPFTRRVFTEQGRFHYTSVGGGSCEFDLYFSKDGYETAKISFQQTSHNDTVYMKRNNIKK